jgi:hypothetical protein
MTQDVSAAAQRCQELPQLLTEIPVSGRAKVVNGDILTSFTVSGVAP